jgi:UDP-N-acetylglucosamine--N-acetylmuramyl-(pentapeptide) pyrophosphoryl-undecaprenol N-acetylglucosamine transferase
MDAANYILAGGGTGGHLFPGLAVADALRRRQPDAQILFLTTDRPLDRQLLNNTPFTQILQPVRPFTLNPLRMPGFLHAWHRSVAAAKQRLTETRVHAVLGLGGYAAGPAVVAAQTLGVRNAILNPDAVPGRANRHLARKTDLVITQWDISEHHFPSGTPCQTLGCPIRAAFAGAKRADGLRHFNLTNDHPVLLVTGASQGAHTINLAMMRVWPEFLAAHPEWQLLHLSGPADEQAVRAAYAASGAPARVVDFTHEMPLAIAAADAVVARAGASTLAELTALGKPAILLPYPYHRDRHQHANARVLVRGGAALVIEDQRDPVANEPLLHAALGDIAQPEKRLAMAAAARELGRVDAAEAVAGWLLA